MESILDKKIEFKHIIAPFKAALNVLFPWIDYFKENKNETAYTGHTLFNIKQGQPIIIKSEKMMSQYEKMYGKLDSDFALNTVKMGLKREICDEIMRSDLFEWSIQETAMGTRVGARIIINKF